ncbi:hypothetical protein KFK09_028312 [Dendrobium nobile]|uniref:Uncharacterized protein n=1 Tax=Dendrobium nobile TaxID=94219 RepID=A0A8T3A309_DENNO|nr:hypothetical protein KFK09_028312 [Dendrobium nobile]
MVLQSDGSKRWTLLKSPTTFYTTWSPIEKGIIFTSIGSIFDSTNSEAYNIYLVRLDGLNLLRVHFAGPPGLNEDDRERINHVCFSPDSKWLHFTTNLGSILAETMSMPNPFQPYGDMWFFCLDGTGLTRLTCNAFENGMPAWHAADRLQDIGLIFVVPAAGENLRGQFEEPLWQTCDI